VHHTDRDRWGSAALFVSHIGPAACRLYPCDRANVLAATNDMPAADGDTLWVLDSPAPTAGWAGLRQHASICWVDHRWPRDRFARSCMYQWRGVQHRQRPTSPAKNLPTALLARRAPLSPPGV
jgi:hypothetical protein